MYFLKSVGCRWNYFVEGNLDLNIAHFRLKAVFCFGRISFRAQLVSFKSLLSWQPHIFMLAKISRHQRSLLPIFKSWSITCSVPLMIKETYIYWVYFLSIYKKMWMMPCSWQNESNCVLVMFEKCLASKPVLAQRRERDTCRALRSFIRVLLYFTVKRGRESQRYGKCGL